MAYTEAQITELKSIEDLNYDKAKVFAEKHDINVRSVIAKARALEVPYTSKVPMSKAKKAAVRRKSDIVASINDLLDITLTSLEKLTAKDLEVLEARAKEMAGA